MSESMSTVSTAASAERRVIASRLAVAAISGAFLVSGVAALTFEALWFRQASLAFGNSVWASSLVLSGFMFGMALGAWLASHFGDRTRSPVRAFIALELTVAWFGVALVYALPALQQSLAAASVRLEAQPLLLQSLRLGCAFVLLLVPSTAMGATLPLLVRALPIPTAGFGRALGFLYGVNTLGAVIGALWVELWLIPSFGIRQSAYAAAGCNLSAAALAALVSAHAAPPPVVSPGPAAHARRQLAAGFLSGFTLLGLEVVWLRCLTLFLNDTPLAFALVLAAVLVALALGSLAAGFVTGRFPRASAAASLCAWVAGIAAVLSFRLYGSVLERWYRPDQSTAGMFAIAAALVAPTAFASGALFSLLGTQLRELLGLPARAVGRLSALNLLGSGLGPLVVGFVLLPRLGAEATLFGLIALYGVTGSLAYHAQLSRRAPLVLAGAFVLALVSFPFGQLRARYVGASAGRWLRGEGEVVSVRDGLTGTLVHIVHRFQGLDLFDQLATNAYSMTVNDFAARRYMKQFVYLPRALHPKLSSALVVGHGIGNTTAALVAEPTLERIDVVDISPETIELSRSLRSASAGGLKGDPRVHVHIEDGRHFLAGQTRRYDLITGEPPPPIIAGVVDLYTLEYFSALRARLAPGGMVTHWLPMMNLSDSAGRSIIAAFCAAFEDCSLWHGSARNFMLFGTNAATGPVSAAHFQRTWADSEQRAEATRLGFERPEQLGAAFIGDAAYLAELTRGHAPLQDDRPRQIQAPGTREERDALIWQWRDTRAARQRFMTSPLIERLWPAELRTRTARNFENQRLLNDLLFPERTGARQIGVLHEVLSRTPLRLPALLLLNSDPDIQLSLSRAPETVRERPGLRLHRLAGLLSARDFDGAQALLGSMSDAELPLPGLRGYVQRVVQGLPPFEASAP